MFDLASGKFLLGVQVLRGRSLALSPDGTLLAFETGNDAIQLWSVDRGQQIGTLGGKGEPLSLVCPSPPMARRWPVASPSRGSSCGMSKLSGRSFVLDGFDGPRQVLFSWDGSCLAVRSLDGRLQLWRAPSFEEIAATELREQAEGKQP